MKKTQTVSDIVLVAALCVLGLGVGFNKVAAAEARAPFSTPAAAVTALHEALSSGNAGDVEAVLDPDVIILEAGNVERSRKEYAAHHLAADLKYMKSVDYKLERQSADTVGDLAWVVSEARLTGNRDGKPIEIVSTETLVLKNSAAGWKVVHIHWSSRNAKAT